MAQQLRKAQRLHADESGWHLFVKFDAKENYKWYIGVFVSQDIVLFVLAPGRSAEVPGKVLFNLNATQLKLLNTTPFDGEIIILSPANLG